MGCHDDLLCENVLPRYGISVLVPPVRRIYAYTATPTAGHQQTNKQTNKRSPKQTETCKENRGTVLTFSRLHGTGTDCLHDN